MDEVFNIKILNIKFCSIILTLFLIYSSNLINANKSINIGKNILCQACQKTFSSLQNSEYKYQKIFLKFIFTEICIIEKMFSKEICKGVVEEMTNPVMDSLYSRYLDPDLICPKLKICPNVYKELNIDEYAKDILKDKPKIGDSINNKNLKTNSSYNANITKNRKLLKILHISDLHTDVEYLEGSNASCEYPICCREESRGRSREETDEIKAGKWGTLASCDLPIQTVKQFVNFVNENLKIDFALWTGDNTSHDIWHQTYERNLKNTKEITEIFKNNFNFTIFPVVGNHESFPVNVYDFLSPRETYFDNYLGDIWQLWIGEEATENFKKYAYYTKYIENLNLKIIGLNSQACNSQNWYLIKDSTDPGQMLNWLREELYKAERNNQNVYIISHFPPNSCLENWVKIYNAIIDRFSLIIKAQFAGHTHGDRFQVNRDSFTGKVNNVVFMPASLTTFTNRNPSFRVYDVDAENFNVINYSVYRLNLNKWNALSDENIMWDLAYEFTKEYDLNDASNESFEILQNKLLSDDSIVQKFSINESSGVDMSKKSTQDKSYFCGTISDPDESAFCNGSHFDIYDKIVTYLRGDWREKIKKEN